MPAYVSNCKNCDRRIEIDWDGNHDLLPAAATCSFCGYADGYGQDRVVLVGAFEVTCSECEDPILAEIPVASVDYTQPTGLRAPIELTCKSCGHTGSYQPGDVVWLGRGEPMPQARAAGVGQQRP